MTWTRLDDTFTDSSDLAGLAHDVRWHYLAMIQFCSRTKRYDGVLKIADALRCSDVSDPAGAVDCLTTVGLVSNGEPGTVKLVLIDDHIPPPSVRENSEQSKVRMRRMRKHKNGDHSTCLPDQCKRVQVDPSTGEVSSAEVTTVTAPVTRNTRTGQDGTGLYGEVPVSPSRDQPSLGADGWPLELCQSCGEPMQTYEPGQTVHPGCPIPDQQRWSA